MIDDEQIVALDCMLQLEADRRYYVLRCLELEAQIVALKRERADGWPLPRFRRFVQASDIEQMRAMKRRGMKPSGIAQRLGWSYPTVVRYTRDVLREREVGAL